MTDSLLDNQQLVWQRVASRQSWTDNKLDSRQREMDDGQRWRQEATEKEEIRGGQRQRKRKWGRREDIDGKEEDKERNKKIERKVVEEREEGYDENFKN